MTHQQSPLQERIGQETQKIMASLPPQAIGQSYYETVLKKVSKSLTTIAQAAVEEERKAMATMIDKIAYDTAIEESAKYANETEWKQPYAGNRMMHLGWKIGDKIRAAFTTLKAEEKDGSNAQPGPDRRDEW